MNPLVHELDICGPLFFLYIKYILQNTCSLQFPLHSPVISILPELTALKSFCQICLKCFVYGYHRPPSWIESVSDQIIFGKQDSNYCYTIEINWHCPLSDLESFIVINEPKMELNYLSTNVDTMLERAKYLCVWLRVFLCIFVCVFCVYGYVWLCVF